MEAKFHLSLPCKDLNLTRSFYMDDLGLPIGRSTDSWMDVNLFGNQITFICNGRYNFDCREYKLDKHILPAFHFGVIIYQKDWDGLYNKMRKDPNLEVTMVVNFMQNKTGEHHSFFIKDPNGYTLEFKTFTDQNEIFNKGK
ncbi:VOC family protein [Sediminicola luteus]|uniref:Glyoxalase/fosfomycin resistance/dioxygenase domain-containing protein n=1 Tax=Sediminicola luteus TaxID=319238 RepID=A0A2A4G3J1_9FLAO|nr:VOC family protein [Sediminicola luteus]PCE62993.1 hypothetical protein B7P33_17100 [Sediminicola luteus]